MFQTRKGLWRLLALLMAATLLMAACGDDDDEGGGQEEDGGTKRTVAIGFVGPLTGDNANLGINIRNGARMAIDEANAEGDLDVRLVLKDFDTQGDPAQAQTLKDDFINDEEIVAIVGPTFSGETKAVIPDLQTAEMAMISASATNTELPTVVEGQTVFHRVVPDDAVQGAALADYISKELQAQKIAFVHDNSDYGKAVAEGTRDFLVEELQVDAVLTEAIDPRGQDYSAAVNKVKAAAPDAVFYGGYYAEAGRLKKQLTDAGVEAVFLSGDGSLDVGFVESGGVAGTEGAQVTCACNFPTPESEGELGEFATRYKEKFKRDPGTYSPEGYDAANILINGIRAGNDDRASLLEYVENEVGTYEGVSKTIEFEDNGNVKATEVYAYEYKGGKIVNLGKIEELVGG